MVSNAFDRSINRICSSCVASFTCSCVLSIASIVDSCVLYPYCAFHVSMCSIVASLFVRSCDQILYMTCVRHIGRYGPHSCMSPFCLYICTMLPCTHSFGSFRPCFIWFRIVHISFVIHGVSVLHASPGIPSLPCAFWFLSFLWIFLFLLLRSLLVTMSLYIGICSVFL